MTVAKSPLEHLTVDSFSTRIHCNTMFVPFLAFSTSRLCLAFFEDGDEHWRSRWKSKPSVEKEVPETMQNHWYRIDEFEQLEGRDDERQGERNLVLDLSGADHLERFSNTFVRHSFERNRTEISRVFESNESNSCFVQSRRYVHHQVMIFIRIRADVSGLLSSGSEDSWFYVWRTEPSNTTNTSGTSSVSTLLTRNQRRHFGRAFERIRGEHTSLFSIDTIDRCRSSSVHNTMVTSAIFAPNSLAIMDYLYASTVPLSSDHSSSTHRLGSTHSISSPRNIATTISAAVPTHHRARLSCVHASSSPVEVPALLTHQGPTYVMITADSKGQLKLLVNRFHR